MLNARLSMIVRVLGTLVLLGVLLTLVPLSHVTDMLRRADVQWVIGGFMLSLLARLASAERTYSITRAMSLSLSRRQTIETLFISNFWSLLLPGVSAGTVVSVYRYRQIGVTLGEGVGALGVSRIVEASVYSMLTVLAWVLLANQGVVGGQHTALIASIGCALMLMTIAGCLYFRTAFRVPVTGDEGHPTLRSRFSSVLAALTRVPPTAYPVAGAFAAAQALLDAASLVLFAHALDLPLKLLEAVWINGVAYMAILLPVSIAGLGARDVAVVAASAPLGFVASDVLAVSVLMLAATLLNALVGAAIQFFMVARQAPSLDDGSPRRRA